MNYFEQLEEVPAFELVRYRSGSPQNAVAFSGTLRQHPYDADKCILLADPHSYPDSPAQAAVLEFRKADVLGVEEMASPVDESGHSRQVMRLWIRRGSRGVRLEPFEVGEPPRRYGEHRAQERVFKSPRP
jgi:hypothetical protein